MDNKNMHEEKCCIVTCDLPLDETYWNNQYDGNTTGWDLGEVSPPLKAYIDQLANKNLRILIPGCGNAYEAEYLLQAGFTDVTVIDIAPTLIAQLQQKFATDTNINTILGDFFKHQGEYDLILEQTFFCAINPQLRKDYVTKMNELLAINGKLVGVGPGHGSGPAGSGAACDPASLASCGAPVFTPNARCTFCASDAKEPRKSNSPRASLPQNAGSASRRR